MGGNRTMTEEQLQKFYAMVEPRSEEAIRKAEERRRKRLTSKWHKGSDKPEIYKDKITGNTHDTYAVCLTWYDMWIEEFCKVTEDNKFISMLTGSTYDSDAFEYWAYTYDLYQDLENEIID